MYKIIYIGMSLILLNKALMMKFIASDITISTKVKLTLMAVLTDCVSQMYFFITFFACVNVFDGKIEMLRSRYNRIS